MYRLALPAFGDEWRGESSVQTRKRIVHFFKFGLIKSMKHILAERFDLEK